MSHEDRERWDSKHRAARGASVGAVDSLVIEALEAAALPPGARILDFACGRGRHALEFARRGFEACAWDVSEVALEEVSELAEAADLAVETRAIDAEASGWTEGAASFDLVCIVNFLDRELPLKIKKVLAQGGSLLLCTFTDDYEGAHPSVRHRLRAGELRAGWPGYELRFYCEREGRAVLLATALEE